MLGRHFGGFHYGSNTHELPSKVLLEAHEAHGQNLHISRPGWGHGGMDEKTPCLPSALRSYTRLIIKITYINYGAMAEARCVQRDLTEELILQKGDT